LVVVGSVTSQARFAEAVGASLGELLLLAGAGGLLVLLGTSLALGATNGRGAAICAGVGAVLAIRKFGSELAKRILPAVSTSIRAAGTGDCPKSAATNDRTNVAVTSRGIPVFLDKIDNIF